MIYTKTTLRPQHFAWRVWHRLTTSSRHRKTVNCLNALSDHTRRDIGIERGSIDLMAIGTQQDTKRYSD